MNKKHRDERILLFIALTLIVVGLLTNEWILVKIFSADGEIENWKRALVRTFNLGFICAGAILFFMRSRIQFVNIVLLLISCLFCLILGEFALQIFDKEAEFRVLRPNPNGTGSYRLIPHLDLIYRYKINGEERKFVIKTNSHGMRWKEVARQKTHNYTRVVFTGDSFTFGESADKIENSFVGIFADNFKNQDIEILNFGVVGYGLDDIELQIKEEILPFHPDYIILMIFNGNDLRDTYLGVNKFDISSGIAKWNTEVFKEKVPKKYVSQDIFNSENDNTGKYTTNTGIGRYISKSKVLKRLKQLFLAFNSKSKGTEFLDKKNLHDPADFIVSPYFTSFTFWSQKNYDDVMLKAKNITLCTLHEIYNLCIQNGIKLIVVTIPFEEQVYSKTIQGIDKNNIAFDTRLPQFHIQEFAHEYSIPYLDLLPFLRGYVKKSNKQIFPDTFIKKGDLHLNNQGHAVVGDILTRFFREKIIKGLDVKQ